ncbi:MAG TPA: (d)CMP kinase [Gemmatimonadaceae bacterium]|jgi:cytidylate kinase|nr:(d)CMP kinase [Gemmatimonadaceae bacterium]
MSARVMVIAIDGPAASGKSSTAQWVARRLGFFHVDSGSLYRAATAVQLQRVPNPEAWVEDSVLAEARRITFVPSDGTFLPLIDAKPCDDVLRGTEVTRNVSRVATMPRVRAWVNAQVRIAGASQNVVVDGRDIGTVVFPDADLKVFLVADPWERARRRLIQRLGRHPSDGEIAGETELIVKRDAKDATQTVQAADAVLIDTTYLTQEDQVERIVALAKAVTAHPGRTSAVDE